MRWFRRVEFVFFILYTIISLFFIITRSKIETSPLAFVPEDEPSVRYYDEMVRIFENRENIFVLIEGEIFDDEVINKVKSAERKLKDLESVESVFSYVDAVKFSVRLLPFPSIRLEKYLDVGIEKILDDPLYSGRMVSKDGKVGLMIIGPSRFVNEKITVGDFVNEIEEILRDFNLSYRMMGEFYIESQLFKNMKNLLFREPPLIFLLIFFLFLLRLKKIKFSLLAFLPALISMVWTYGTMFMIGKVLNSLTSLVGVFVLIIGSAYGLHLVARVKDRSIEMNWKDAVLKGSRLEFYPITFSALTTMVGYLSFVVVGLKAFMDLGMFVTLGIAFSLFITLRIIPPILLHIPDTGRKRKMRFLHIYPRLRRWVIITITVATVTGGLYGILGVNLDTDPIRFFRKESDVVKNAEFMREKFGYIGNLNIIVEKKGGSDFSAEDQIELLKLLDDVSKLPYVHDVQSIFDFHKITGMNFLLLTRLLPKDLIKTYYSAGKLRFNLCLSRTNTKSIRSIMKKFENIRRKYDNIFILKITGAPAIWESINRYVVFNQISSIILAFMFVLCLLFIGFRDFLLSLKAMFPIILTVLSQFFLMRLFNIALDISTSIIASMLIGLVIDFSIHLINATKRNEGDLSEVVETIFTNAFGLMAGFSILLFSKLMLYVNTSILLVGGIGFGLFYVVFMMPAMLKEKR